MVRLFALYSVLCLDLSAHNQITDFIWRILIIYCTRTMIFLKELFLPHFIWVFLELLTNHSPSFPLYTGSIWRVGEGPQLGLRSSPDFSVFQLERFFSFLGQNTVEMGVQGFHVPSQVLSLENSLCCRRGDQKAKRRDGVREGQRGRGTECESVRAWESVWRQVDIFDNFVSDSSSMAGWLHEMINFCSPSPQSLQGSLISLQWMPSINIFMKYFNRCSGILATEDSVAANSCPLTFYFLSKMLFGKKGGLFCLITKVFMLTEMQW